MRQPAQPHNRSIAPLLPIARQGIPFTAADGQAFVRLPVVSSGGFFFLPVRSRAYRDWFFQQFFALYDTLPTPQAFYAILNHLEAQAAGDELNQRLTVSRRVGSRVPSYIPKQILLDLANPERQFVDISPDGWTVAAGTHALLETSRSTNRIPTPVPSNDPATDLETLRSCLNLPSRSDWLRCLAWLLAALRPSGPYPFLIFQGPPGSGKTFAARILRYLIDPSAVPLTPIPSSVRDLLALARHNWVLAFDHISAFSPRLTDALCRLSSGAGFSFREEARSSEPMLQSYRRPVILTVTSRWSCPADLAGRALTVTMPPIPPAERRPEAALMATLEEAWPRILGAFCSALSVALRRIPEIMQPSARRPSDRCADALAWALAASPALGCTAEEIEQAFDPAPPSHPMVEAVQALVEQRRRWTGSATALFDLLQPALDCRTPKGLSQQLRKCMLTLADAGIELKFRRLHGGGRVIDLLEDSPDASPVFADSAQITETKELTTA
ncbi:MAG TPA: hypothetical protein VE959_00160 [Bryobacteraceae bacterium]|nr:hypothetical protein [Bryobacteraceae bacterium]